MTADGNGLERMLERASYGFLRYVLPLLVGVLLPVFIGFVGWQSIEINAKLGVMAEREAQRLKLIEDNGRRIMANEADIRQHERSIIELQQTTKSVDRQLAEIKELIKRRP